MPGEKPKKTNIDRGEASQVCEICGCTLHRRASMQPRQLKGVHTQQNTIMWLSVSLVAQRIEKVQYENLYMKHVHGILKKRQLSYVMTATKN